MLDAIKRHSICILTETWLHDSELCDFELKGFKTYHLVRPSRTSKGRHHGGVSVYVRAEFSNRVKLLQKSARSGSIWLHVHKSLVPGAKRDVALAACYFSPKESRLYSQGVLDPEPFVQLQHDVLKFNCSYHTLCAGDFNARMGVAPDFTSVSDDDACFIPLPEPDFQTDPKTRSSCDHITNDFGTQFLQLLHVCGLIIYNGRTNGDLAGQLTCKPFSGDGGSLVDIFAGTIDLHTEALCLHHDEHNDLVSNHCLLALSFQHLVSTTISTPDAATCAHRMPRTMRPTAEQCQLYAALLQEHRVSSSTPSSSQTHVTATTLVTDILASIRAAIRNLPPPAVCALDNSLNWWTPECEARRAQFHAAFHAATTQVQKAAERRCYKKFLHGVKEKHTQQLMMVILDVFFSDDQGKFWRFLQGGRVECAISDVEAWTSHFTEVLNLVHCKQPPAQMQQLLHQHKGRLFAATSNLHAAAEDLNKPLSTREIFEAINKMRNGAACDLDGLTAECLKHAYFMEVDGTKTYVLLHQCYDLISHVFNTGDWPTQWVCNTLTPIFKKSGDSHDMDNYRGIAVGSILGKVFSNILTHRLNCWAEQYHVRAISQAGFRPAYGPLDHIFVLRHLVDKARFTKQPLFCCFVDFRKAFDTCQRKHILLRCERLGIHGAFLAAIKNIYDQVTMSVKVNGNLGQPFQTVQGTKQGDPLSPVLFGLFIEQLHDMLQLNCPGVGPVLGAVCLPDLLYADDVSLLAQQPEHLQELLRVLEIFCYIFDMEVNLSKTFIVIFRRARAAAINFTWIYNGQVVPVEEECKYLGVGFHQTKGWKHMAAALAVKGVRASHALIMRLKSRKIHIPAFKCRIFDALVRPVLSYGCQIWGPDMLFDMDLQKTLSAQHNPLEAVHINFLRMTSGLGKNVYSWALLKEFKRQPLQLHWLTLALRFWNNLRNMDTDRPAHAAFAADVALMLKGCKQCWSYMLLNALTTIGALQREHWVGASAASLLQLSLCEREVVERTLQHYDSVWADMPDDPRCAPSTQVAACTYMRWVGLHDGSGPAHIHVHLPFLVRRTLLQLRLGVHHLEIQLGRMRKHRVPREHRLCGLCGNGDVEDLKHFLLHCTGLRGVRQQYGDLFWADMRCDELLTSPDQQRLAFCLHKMYLYRQTMMNKDTSITS